MESLAKEKTKYTFINLNIHTFYNKSHASSKKQYLTIDLTLDKKCLAVVLIIEF